MKKSMRFGSQCVREPKTRMTTKPHILPLYATSSFVFENVNQGIDIFSGKDKGHVYSRYGNPTIDAVAGKIASLEGHGLNADPGALLFSSGMSAILTLILATLKAGDQIMTQANLYGGTTEQFLKILKPNGIEPVFVDLADLNQVEDKLESDKRVKMIYAESPANPTLSCIDLESITDMAHRHQALMAVDNTFPTPYLQQPLSFGVDFIVHSTTKYLNGHGNSLAGSLVVKDKDRLQREIWPVMKLAGTNCNPWDAWLTNTGLKTLGLRMDKHCANAGHVAKFLNAHPKVSKVNYPGLPQHPSYHLAKKQMKGAGGMLSFEIDGDINQSVRFMEELKFCILAPTLGDVDTLVLHPATMSHINIPREIRLAQGISDNLVRLSVGIEDVEDIIGDLDQALRQL